MAQDNAEQGAPAPSAKPKKSLAEGVLEVCLDNGKFDQFAQEMLKERDGRLGIEAARQDLQIVCDEFLHGLAVKARPGRVQQK